MAVRDKGVRGIMECLLLILKGNPECSLVDLLKWTRVVEMKYRSARIVETPPSQPAPPGTRK